MCKRASGAAEATLETVKANSRSSSGACAGLLWGRQRAGRLTSLGLGAEYKVKWPPSAQPDVGGGGGRERGPVNKLYEILSAAIVGDA